MLKHVLTETKDWVLALVLSVLVIGAIAFMLVYAKPAKPAYPEFMQCYTIESYEDEKLQFHLEIQRTPCDAE